MQTAFPIDTVSNMYPAMAHGKHGYCYRLRAILRENADLEILRRAVYMLADSYPILYSHLEKNFFSYQHIAATDLDIISGGETDLFLPALYNTNKPSFRIQVHKNTVSLDVYHGNGDGAASMRYFKALFSVYFALADGRSAEPFTAKAPDTVYADAYLQNFDKSRNANFIGGKKALHIKLPAAGDYTRFSCISICTAQLKSFLKGSGFSVNDYLTAALYFSIKPLFSDFKTKKPIVLSIPINLRPFFDSDSQRNFSYFVNAAASLNAPDDFFDLMRLFSMQVHTAATPDFLRNGIAATVKTVSNPLVRYAPRSLKEAVIRFICKYISFAGITTTLSNLGYHGTAADFENRIERFEVYLGASQPGSFNASAVGFGDTVSMCFSTASKSREIENRFAEILKTHGIAHTYAAQEFNENPIK